MHFTVQCRITVFIVLLAVFSLNITFWVQDTDDRHCATVGHWKDLKWHSELSECALHDFTITDVVACLHGQRIAFIGDERMQQLFIFFASLLTAEPHIMKDNLHLSVNMDSANIAMDYYQHNTVDEEVDNVYQHWKLESGAPRLILHNGCSWILGRRHTMSELLSWTTHNISRLIGSQQDFLSVYPTSEIYWLPHDSSMTDKLWGRTRRSADKHILACDEAIRHAYIGSAVHYVEPLVGLATERPSQRTEDNASYQNLTLKAKLDVVLSSYCSLPDPKLSPYCCVRPQPGQWLLVAMVLSVALFLGANMIVATNTLTGLRPFIQAGKQIGLVPFSNQRLSVIGQVTSSICNLIVILLFVYVCDRTFLFVKTDKIAAMPIFLLLLLCSILGGLLTLNESEEYGFLDDQQVDEFKGIAMLFILCYGYMAPVIQQSAFPYSIHHLSVGLYLFVDSYSSFVTSRSTRSLRIGQLVRRLVHINLFPFLLGLLLKSSYSVYYLTPVLSLSCIFTYLIVSAHPRIIDFSYHNSVIITKLTLIAVTLWFLPPINSLIRPKQQGWRTVIKLIDDNKFVPLLGVIVGLIKCKTKEAEWSVYKLSTGLQFVSKLVILLGSVSAMLLMTVISHSYLSFIAFLAVVFLRNYHSSLQKYNSYFLQIAGVLSYELFLLQFHTWTAYQGSALLLMTPEIELVNFLVATLILTSVSDYLNSTIESVLRVYCDS